MLREFVCCPLHCSEEYIMILKEQYYQWRMWRLTDEQVKEAKAFSREHIKEMYIKHSGRDKIGEQALDRECIEAWFQKHIDELDEDDSETMDYEFYIEDDEGNDYGYDEEDE